MQKHIRGVTIVSVHSVVVEPCPVHTLVFVLFMFCGLLKVRWTTSCTAPEGSTPKRGREGCLCAADSLLKVHTVLHPQCKVFIQRQVVGSITFLGYCIKCTSTMKDVYCKSRSTAERCLPEPWHKTVNVWEGMNEEREKAGKKAEQVEKESKRWRKQAEGGRLKTEKKSNWPCSITSLLSLIIAKSPKQSKQTKSGLMYFPVTTAWREPNHCQMSFWKTPLVNMPLCMADSNWGPPPLSSHLFSFTFYLFISKVKREGTCWMCKNTFLTRPHVRSVLIRFLSRLMSCREQREGGPKFRRTRPAASAKLL